MNNDTGKAVVHIGSADNGGFLNAIDTVKIRARLRALPRGELVVLNDAGKRVVVVWIGEWDDVASGGLFLGNPAGDRKVQLGVYKDGDGYIQVNGRNVHDYAEILELATREGIRPGSVVAWDSNAGGLVPVSASNTGSMIGVISGAGGFNPGMTIGSRADESADLPVLMAGAWSTSGSRPRQGRCNRAICWSRRASPVWACAA